EAVARHLLSAAQETPKPGDQQISRAEFRLIATPLQSLEAAAAAARQSGVEPYILGPAIEGEARMTGYAHAAIALKLAGGAGPVRPPCVVLSGGETTVTVKGKGRGGNNSEFLLALALGLQGTPGISALACDTDGIDGTGDNAGAVVLPDTLARAAASGINATACLDTNDSYGFFDALGDLVITGPTGTNVSDFRAIYVEVGHS
ncbi:MAG: glycerate kinase, partial [Deltaproteobacteria bacterium]|nr:glycerate kinase [Deltaproteobacteria bacterium]